MCFVALKLNCFAEEIMNVFDMEIAALHASMKNGNAAVVYLCFTDLNLLFYNWRRYFKMIWEMEFQTKSCYKNPVCTIWFTAIGTRIPDVAMDFTNLFVWRDCGVGRRADYNTKWWVSWLRTFQNFYGVHLRVVTCHSHTPNRKW